MRKDTITYEDRINQEFNAITKVMDEQIADGVYIISLSTENGYNFSLNNFKGGRTMAESMRICINNHLRDGGTLNLDKWEHYSNTYGSLSWQWENEESYQIQTEQASY
jgi:hypothetical protein